MSSTNCCNVNRVILFRGNSTTFTYGVENTISGLKSYNVVPAEFRCHIFDAIGFIESMFRAMEASTLFYYLRGDIMGIKCQIGVLLHKSTQIVKCKELKKSGRMFVTQERV